MVFIFRQFLGGSGEVKKTNTSCKLLFDENSPSDVSHCIFLGSEEEHQSSSNKKAVATPLSSM